MKKIIALSLVLLVSACTHLKVTRDHVPGFDYSQLKTYSLFPRSQQYPQSLSQSAITLDRIEAALITELNKNYKQLNYQTQHTDFVVAYHLVATSQYKYDSHSHFSGWHTGFFNQTYRERRYEVGNLIIDIYDTKNRKQIWHGVVSSQVKDKASPQEREVAIKTALSELLSGFPPTK